MPLVESSCHIYSPISRMFSLPSRFLQTLPVFVLCHLLAMMLQIVTHSSILYPLASLTLSTYLLQKGTLGCFGRVYKTHTSLNLIIRTKLSSRRRLATCRVSRLCLSHRIYRYFLPSNLLTCGISPVSPLPLLNNPIVLPPFLIIEPKPPNNSYLRTYTL